MNGRGGSGHLLPATDPAWPDLPPHAAWMDRIPVEGRAPGDHHPVWALLEPTGTGNP